MLRSTLFSLATLLPLLSRQVYAKQVSVSLVRWRNFQDRMADFYIGEETDYELRRESLRFWYDPTNPSRPFTLDGDNSPGYGVFRVGLGDGKWANCHLTVVPGAEATSDKKFQFAPSDRDNYLFPWQPQEWVAVVCGGTEPLCEPKGWEAPAQQVRPPM